MTRQKSDDFCYVRLVLFCRSEILNGVALRGWAVGVFLVPHAVGYDLPPSGLRTVIRPMNHKSTANEGVVQPLGVTSPKHRMSLSFLLASKRSHTRSRALAYFNVDLAQLHNYLCGSIECEDFRHSLNALRLA